MIINAAVYKLVFSVHIHMYACILCYNCLYMYVYVCTYSYSVNVLGCFEVVHTMVLNVECIQHRLKQFNDSGVLLLKPTIKYFMCQYKKTHLIKHLQLCAC